MVGIQQYEKESPNHRRAYRIGIVTIITQKRYWLGIVSMRAETLISLVP